MSRPTDRHFYEYYSMVQTNQITFDDSTKQKMFTSIMPMCLP